MVLLDRPSARCAAVLLAASATSPASLVFRAAVWPDDYARVCDVRQPSAFVAEAGSKGFLGQRTVRAHAQPSNSTLDQSSRRVRFVHFLLPTPTACVSIRRSSALRRRRAKTLAWHRLMRPSVNLIGKLTKSPSLLHIR